MISKIAAILIVIVMLSVPMASATQAPATNATEDMNMDLSEIQHLIVPTSQQCTQEQPPMIIDDFESGIGGVAVTGAAASLDTSNPIFGKSSLDLQLSGSARATVKLAGLNLDPLMYTGIVVWVDPSVGGIEYSVGVTANNGTFNAHYQTLRYAGEALPVYIDFASIGAMSQDLGKINTVVLTFTPTSGGTVEIDNVELANAGYGSFNQAWWDVGYKDRYVDQRYQETINDYLSLYTLGGNSTDYKSAIINGMDNIILSRQPDGWVEGDTTGLITAGTLGATLANAYSVLKNDPAMDQVINVYGDDTHTRRWWVEKTLDLDVDFINYIFTTDPNTWIVRNQLLEGARATYCSYLATGNGTYLDDYNNMMSTILAGRQDPIGTYPEWTGTYNASNVMYDASYSAVQFSTLMSLDAMGDSQYAKPMADDLFSVLTNVIDPATGLLMNLNSSRKTYEGDLRWQDGMLYYLGNKDGIPGMVHLGYIENRAVPGKLFPEDFHNALARYYDLKYYVFPAADNQYMLPLECPVYSIDVVDVNGNVVSAMPADISASGNITNPQAESRDPTTFIHVNGFQGSIQPQQDIQVVFGNNSMRIEGNGPVTIQYSSADLAKAISTSGSLVNITEITGGSNETLSKTIDSNGTLTLQVNVNGVLELVLGNGSAPATVTAASAPAPSATGQAAQAVYPIAVGSVVILLSSLSAFMLLKKRKI